MFFIKSVSRFFKASVVVLFIYSFCLFNYCSNRSLTSLYFKKKKERKKDFLVTENILPDTGDFLHVK